MFFSYTKPPQCCLGHGFGNFFRGLATDPTAYPIGCLDNAHFDQIDGVSLQFGIPDRSCNISLVRSVAALSSVTPGRNF